MISSTKENTETIPKKYVIDTWDDEHLSLKIPLLRGIYAFGFEKPSSIQKKTLYNYGRNVMPRQAGIDELPKHPDLRAVLRRLVMPVTPGSQHRRRGAP